MIIDDSLKRPLVLVYDPLSWTRDFVFDVERTMLTDAGVQLVVPADPAERDRLVGDADVVLTFGTVILGPTEIERFDSCVGIQCYSVGTDKVDIDAARRRGIDVSNVNASTVDVADHTMALVLALQRRLPSMFAATAVDNWDLPSLADVADIRRLAGQVFGVVGFGRIGRQVAHRAVAFGFEVLAVDPQVHQLEPNWVDVATLVDIETALARSDVIAICAALDRGAPPLLDADAFARVKPGVLLVNCARGGFIDEAALLDALDRGQVGWAALDVRADEPPTFEALSRHPRVVQTPHMAAASQQSRHDIHYMVAERMIDTLRTAGRLG